MGTDAPRPKVVAIIQARMASTRLPDKVMLDIAGRPMLEHVIERARMASEVDEVVVATTTDPEDEAIAALCDRVGCRVVRGHPTDVLDRYVQAGREHRADVVVRVTADCPLLDPALVDQAVRELTGPGSTADFVANRLPYDRTYPIGLDVEVCRFDDLQQIAGETHAPHHREHVMPFFYENPDRYRVRLLHAPADYGRLRWTVDTAEDLEFVRAVFERLPAGGAYGWEDVLAVLEASPDLSAINARVGHKTQRDVDVRFGRGEA